jgi:hypothetical protein
MLSRPEGIRIAKDISGYGGNILPARPIRPTQSVVARVPEHVCPIGAVRERILTISVLEVVAIVIGIGEHYDIVRFALS